MNQMLKSSTPKEIVFCELVEHPGGHDGGEFPQDHAYGIGDDGVYYSTDFPSSSSDTFSDSEESDFIAVTDIPEALKILNEKRQELENALTTLNTVIRAFEKSKTLTVILDNNIFTS